MDNDNPQNEKRPRPGMTEEHARKIGEAIAFSEAFEDIMNEAGGTLSTVLTGTDLPELAEENRIQIGKLSDMAKIYDSADIASENAEITMGKIKAMQDTYLDDKMDDPTELTDWLGFLEGAAIVHWSNVRRIGTELGDEDIAGLSDSGIALHTRLLEEAASSAGSPAET